jgi:hypothetical protein
MRALDSKPFDASAAKVRNPDIGDIRPPKIDLWRLVLDTVLRALRDGEAVAVDEIITRDGVDLLLPENAEALDGYFRGATDTLAIYDVPTPEGRQYFALDIESGQMLRCGAPRA